MNVSAIKLADGRPLVVEVAEISGIELLGNEVHLSYDNIRGPHYRLLNVVLKGACDSDSCDSCDRRTILAHKCRNRRNCRCRIRPGPD